MNANAVTLHQQSGSALQAPASESAVLIHMIERMARDPSVDLDRFDRLMAMHERLRAAEAKKAFNAAMTAAQSEMERVRADSNNPQTKSRYASYPALDAALRPVYTRHGFSLTFNTGSGAPQDHVRVLCLASHAEGAEREYHIDMPADGKGAKGGDVMTKTHAAGSAVSYGMRYLLKMIFNIAVSLDDDGNKAGATSPVTAEQAKAIDKLISDTGADKAKFLNYFSLGRIEELPAKWHDRAVSMLNSRRAQS